jgi:hypothetical protein
MPPPFSAGFPPQNEAFSAVGRCGVSPGARRDDTGDRLKINSIITAFFAGGQAVAESINYERCRSFLLGIPVAYLLNRMTRKLARPEFMITVAFLSTAIVPALDLLAVLLMSGASYLQDIDWTLTVQPAVRDFLTCLVIDSIMWNNREPPAEKKTHVT